MEPPGGPSSSARTLCRLSGEAAELHRACSVYLLGFCWGHGVAGHGQPPLCPLPEPVVEPGRREPGALARREGALAQAGAEVQGSGIGDLIA
jgi:hypothetical protein